MKQDMKESVERMVPAGVVTKDVEAACDCFIRNMSAIGQSHVVTPRDVAFFLGIYTAIKGKVIEEESNKKEKGNQDSGNKKG